MAVLSIYRITKQTNNNKCIVINEHDKHKGIYFSLKCIMQQYCIGQLDTHVSYQRR